VYKMSLSEVEDLRETDIFFLSKASMYIADREQYHTALATSTLTSATAVYTKAEET